jgi:hypothetical protein
MADRIRGADVARNQNQQPNQEEKRNGDREAYPGS